MNVIQRYAIFRIAQVLIWWLSAVDRALFSVLFGLVQCPQCNGITEEQYYIPESDDTEWRWCRRCNESGMRR